MSVGIIIVRNGHVQPEMGADLQVGKFYPVFLSAAGDTVAIGPWGCVVVESDHADCGDKLEWHWTRRQVVTACPQCLSDHTIGGYWTPLRCRECGFPVTDVATYLRMPAKRAIEWLLDDADERRADAEYC